VLLALTGCASLNSAVNAYGTVMVDNARAANDTAIQAWSVTGCALPYSAILRNPQIIPAIRALCLPQSGAIPAELLSGAEWQR
jgi:hypothetical protein